MIETFRYLIFNCFDQQYRWQDFNRKIFFYSYFYHLRLKIGLIIHRMIKPLFSNAARIIASKLTFKFQPITHLLSTPKFSFTDSTSQTIINKMLAQKDASHNDSCLQQLQQLSQQSKQTVLKLIIRHVDMNKLPSEVIRHPRFIELADGFPEIALQTLMRSIASTEQQLIAQRSKDEPDYERIQQYLQRFSDSFQIWSCKLQELKQPMKTFHYLVELNRTQNYLFQAYIGPYIPKQYREKSFADLYQWNAAIANEMKPNLEKMKLQLTELIARQNQQQKVQQQILHRKHYLLLILDSFAYNLLQSNVLCEKIHQLNQDTLQLRKQQINLESGIEFALQLYQFIGYEDINLYSIRSIELTRLKTFLVLMKDQQYCNLQNPSSDEYKKNQEIVKRELGNMISAIMKQYRQLKNKTSNLNKLSNIAMAIMGVRLQYARRNDLLKNQQEQIAEAKEEILYQIADANAKKIIEQNLSAFIKRKAKAAKITRLDE